MNEKNERISILYEDEYLCVIDKPAGMLTCPYPGSRSKTVQDVLEQIMRKKGTLNSNHKPLVVHRLDRETSGVMMFAFTEAAQKKIMDSWHTMVTERLYHAIAENPRNARESLPDSGLIDDDLAFNAYNIAYVPKKATGAEIALGKTDNKNVKTVPARTHFRIVERGKTHSLFELSLDTGKKNQIRAHLASKNYPLAGDENYRAQTDPFRRVCLHARTLEFVHPYTGKKMMFQVPEPESWLEYVKKGDTHPDAPAWRQEKSRSSKRTRESKNVILGPKRITRKDKAHSNFIEIGKRGKR